MLVALFSYNNSAIQEVVDYPATRLSSRRGTGKADKVTIIGTRTRGTDQEVQSWVERMQEHAAETEIRADLGL